MWYIINKGRFVRDMTKGSGASSYTRDIRCAQKFYTEETAQKNKCDDESVREIIRF